MKSSQDSAVPEGTSREENVLAGREYRSTFERSCFPITDEAGQNQDRNALEIVDVMLQGAGRPGFR
jgi:ABC-type phosphate/phosphonate transport system ATPase subunit